MSVDSLCRALLKIETDLDVTCTCHLSHGPLCPKRVARDAVADHLKEPAQPVFLKYTQDADLVLAVARGLHGRGTIGDTFAREPALGEWDRLDDNTKEVFLADARAAVGAVDKYVRERPT